MSNIDSLTVDSILEGTLITMEQVELAEKALDLVTEYPELFHQGDWLSAGYDEVAKDTVDWIESVEQAKHCGTQACFAGWVAVVDGQQIEETFNSMTGHKIIVSGTDLTVARWASDRLGLLPFEDTNRHPFDADNSIEDLRTWVAGMRRQAEKLGAFVHG